MESKSNKATGSVQQKLWECQEKVNHLRWGWPLEGARAPSWSEDCLQQSIFSSALFCPMWPGDVSPLLFGLVLQSSAAVASAFVAVCFLAPPVFVQRFVCVNLTVLGTNMSLFTHPLDTYKVNTPASIWAHELYVNGFKGPVAEGVGAAFQSSPVSPQLLGRSWTVSGEVCKELWLRERISAFF